MTSTLFRESDTMPRQDWHQTSSGVGHQYRPPVNPSLYDQIQSFYHPLPLGLRVPDRVVRSKMHTTTTGSHHDRKFLEKQQTVPVYKKGPSVQRTCFMNDLSEKLGRGRWQHPLSVGYQKTETQEQFEIKPALRESYRFDEIFKKRPFLLNDHLNNGPTKYGTITTTNPIFSGRIIDPIHLGISDINEPYLTTYRVVYRPYTHDEKDFSKPATIDKDVLEESTSKTIQPMRDHIKFRVGTKIPPLAKATIHVPHSGLLSEYQEIYQVPTDVKHSKDVYCPEDTPFTLPRPSAKFVMSVPRFYTTEYQTIGKREMVPV